MGPTPKYVEKQVLDLGGATGDALTTSREARWCCDFFPFLASNCTVSRRLFSIMVPALHCSPNDLVLT
jgi:hypothetical protein